MLATRNLDAPESGAASPPEGGGTATRAAPRARRANTSAAEQDSSQLAVPFGASPVPAASTATARPVLPSKARLRILFAAALLTTDIAMLLVPIVFAAMLHGRALSVGDVAFGAGGLVPLFLMSASTVRAYSGEAPLSWGTSMRLVLSALAISGGVLAVILLSIDRSAFILPMCGSLLTSAVLMGIVRAFHVRVASRRLGGSLYSVIELRDGVPALCQAPSVDTSHFFDPERPNPFSLDELASVIGNADRVILHCPPRRRAAWAAILKGLNVRAEIVAPEFSSVAPLGAGTYAAMPTLVIASGPLSFQGRVLKRSFDIVYSSIVLVVLAPLLVTVALAIKLDSPGPVLFCQPRIGRQNRLFCVFKFRTMTASGTDVTGLQSASREDCRITRVGRFLRRTSIDELPQFFNVLRGDMSVVGPRPHAINSTAEDRLFWDVDKRYWLRHACRPGLTGLAQVQGLRGATDCTRDLTDRVDADLQYLRSYSFWRDLLIVLGTVRVMFGGKAF